MKIRTVRYYLYEAVSSLVKNRLMSFASILTVASCIFIVSVFYCAAANMEYFLNQLERSISLAVFVHESLNPEDVLLLHEKIMQIPHIKSAEYISKEDAFESFKSELPESEILAGLERDPPFRRSFNIEIDDLQYQDDVIYALEALSVFGIDNIRHEREITAIALTVSNVVRVILMVLILILAVISIVIITNTIRITVNARRSEINIMKYVGATDWFIRWPFVIEGILIGIIGGIIPAVICWLGYNKVIAMIKEGLPVINFVEFRPGHDVFAYLFPFAVLFGILIGLMGSFLSIRRHLRV